MSAHFPNLRMQSWGDRDSYGRYDGLLRINPVFVAAAGGCE